MGFTSSLPFARDCSAVLLVVQKLKDVASYILFIFLVVGGWGVWQDKSRSSYPIMVGN